MVPSHEVFQKPLKVDLQFEDHVVPPGYRDWPGGDKLGPRIKVWKLQTRKYPEIDPGLVSDPYEFADSPDAEVISSGLNSKGPDSVALGRHGNFFLWGFPASPKDMTPEARKCFVNAVCYIKKFDGQRPFVRRTASGRTWALVFARDAERYFDSDFFKQAFPEDLRRRFGKDSSKYIRYCSENLEYLRSTGRYGYAVDEDVKGLGVSNRKPEMLDRCVSMLERGDRPELARRLLKRYTTEDFADAREWRSWLEANRERLFFTDVGGFKWRIAPAPRSTARRPAAEPDHRHPVVAEAELRPERVRAGEAVTLIVRVRTAANWHIYSADGSKGPGIATSLKLRLPDGVEAAGEWSYPEAERGQDGQMIYEGAVEFRRGLRIGPSTALGRIEVGCEIGYQACDPHSCRPPEKSKLVAETEVAGAEPRR